jgi:hypothetical protein
MNKEYTVAYFTLSRYSSGETEKNQEKSHPEQADRNSNQLHPE